MYFISLFADVRERIVHINASHISSRIYTVKTRADRATMMTSTAAATYTYLMTPAATYKCFRYFYLSKGAIIRATSKLHVRHIHIVLI